MTTSRDLWYRYEPIHDLIYFSPRRTEQADALGLRGFWMGYFAFRSAPLGAVPPDVVGATFFGFHRSRVGARCRTRGRTRPWRRRSPPGTPRSTRPLADLGPIERPRRGGRTGLAGGFGRRRLRPSAGCCAPGGAAVGQPTGRPLAGDATLREHRGDGHIAVLVARGIRPAEAHLLKSGAGDSDEADPQDCSAASRTTSGRPPAPAWSTAACSTPTAASPPAAPPSTRRSRRRPTPPPSSRGTPSAPPPPPASVACSTPSPGRSSPPACSPNPTPSAWSGPAEGASGGGTHRARAPDRRARTRDGRRARRARAPDRRARRATAGGLLGIGDAPGRLGAVLRPAPRGPPDRSRRRGPGAPPASPAAAAADPSPQRHGPPPAGAGRDPSPGRPGRRCPGWSASRRAPPPSRSPRRTPDRRRRPRSRPPASSR